MPIHRPNPSLSAIVESIENSGEARSVRLANDRELHYAIHSYDRKPYTMASRRDESALDEAARWLHLELVYGPVPAVKIFTMAKTQEIAEMTLRRAAKVLNVQGKIQNGWGMGLVFTVLFS